ncbi:MAG: PD-(D/E)XK nuclease superfamily protein [Methanosaeta sp. PtaU1.Bin028]|nr:MAG: PD-(D/E)XK nuclease superfamily protein [Methanosaeta sp. PtaU1.Bin028]
MVLMVRISDISRYLCCPRLIYFERGQFAPELVSPSHILLRHMLLSWQAGSDPSDMEEAILRLIQDLLLIYPQISQADLLVAADEVRHLLPDLILLPAERLVPSELEVELRSERLGLTGRLDRMVVRQRQAAMPRPNLLSSLLDRAGLLVSPPSQDATASGRDEGSDERTAQADQPLVTPSLIRTGKAPKSGVWRRDRLSLAGYSLLLQEKYGQPVVEGQVEYARSCQIRQVAIRGLDKGRFLRLCDRVRQIRRGSLPDRPANAPCSACPCRDACHSRASLASRFF